jgi:hypothetical protein
MHRVFYASVVRSGRCSTLAVCCLEVKVLGFGREEYRADEFEIRGVVCVVWENEFSHASINSAMVFFFEKVENFSS